MAKAGMKIALDRTADVFAGLRALKYTRVFVGVPADKNARDDGPITNAALAYIHDRGSPEVNIPARPFMQPGIASVKTLINDGLKKAGQLALERGAAAVLRQFARVGTIASNAIKSKINEGIPPPLKESTLKARARRGRKGAQKELANRDKGLPASVLLAKPLIDTAQMRNSITYVVRSK